MEWAHRLEWAHPPEHDHEFVGPEVWPASERNSHTDGGNWRNGDDQFSQLLAIAASHDKTLRTGGPLPRPGTGTETGSGSRDPTFLPGGRPPGR